MADDAHGTPAGARKALASIDTSPVGFAVFDRVLLTVHPTDCAVREYFAQRLLQQGSGSDARGAVAPADQPGRPDAAHGQPHGRQLPRRCAGC